MRILVPSDSRHWRGRRRAAVVAVAMLVVAGSPTLAHADHGGAAAEKAAAEIQAARDRADAAAQALFDEESTIDQLELDIAAAEADLAELEGEAEEMRTGLEFQAVRQFVGAGGTNFPLLIDLDDANDALTADVMSSIASETANVDLDDFDALMKEVEEQSESLESQRNDAQEATETYAALQADAEAEVVKLGEIEAQRLEDEAVQHELERQQRERAERERREREAAEEAAAEAAAAEAAAAAEEAAAAEQARVAEQSAQQTPAAVAATTSSGPAAAAQTPAQPEPVPPPAAPESAGSGLACPIAGPRSFADTWGASRSGGRSHEGVDMMSPGGTPLVAMEAGRVEFTTNGLGGNTVRLYGASGTRYYYAHLSAWEGSSRPVSKGDVIGYVGKTGNTSANHLHLQVHPGGGQAVNPYPYARGACG